MVKNPWHESPQSWNAYGLTWEFTYSDLTAHRTFQEYCSDRFDYSRRKMDYLIAGSEVFENLQMRTNGSQILPTSERQVRPLTKLEPDQQREVWTKAVESAGRTALDLFCRV